MSDSSSNYDMPVMVGAIVVGLIACGIFFYTKPEPIRPPAPPEPIFTPPTTAAASPVMIDTSGTGKTPEGGMASAAPGVPGGGPAPTFAGNKGGGMRAN
jgi:hypothetical protein